MAEIATAISRFMARFDPRPAWKNRWRLVTIGGLALALTIGLVWLTQRGPEPPVSPTDEKEQVPIQRVGQNSHWAYSAA